MIYQCKQCEELKEYADEPYEDELKLCPACASSPEGLVKFQVLHTKAAELKAEIKAEARARAKMEATTKKQLWCRLNLTKCHICKNRLEGRGGFCEDCDKAFCEEHCDDFRKVCTDCLIKLNEAEEDDATEEYNEERLEGPLFTCEECNNKCALGSLQPLTGEDLIRCPHCFMIISEEETESAYAEYDEYNKKDDDEDVEKDEENEETDDE